jgi:nitroreductase
VNVATLRSRVGDVWLNALVAVLPLARGERRASLVYALRPKVFGREQKAVAAGRLLYLDSARDDQSRFLLRRNVHMLEKGLSMRPRRTTFATEYIGETVDVLDRVRAGRSEADCRLDDELKWANDVLTEYFSVASGDPRIEAAAAAFRGFETDVAPRSQGGPRRPYRRGDGELSDEVSIKQFIRLCEQRRSTRWFLPDPVPRDVLERAGEAAALSPSACNRQPYEFRVIEDPAAVQRIAKLPLGTKGWVHNIPTFVVVIGDLSAFFSERDRHTIYTDSSLAIMSFVLALETMGVASCCVNWPDIAKLEVAMARELELDDHQRPVMCLAVGYPDPAGLVPYSQKRSMSKVVTYHAD